MPQKLNNVELYKAMTGFFRETNHFKSTIHNHGVGSGVDDKKINGLLNELLSYESEFRRTVQKVNSNSIHLGHGATLNKDLHEFETTVKEIDNALPEKEDNGEARQSLQRLLDSLGKMKEEFNNLKG